MVEKLYKIEFDGELSEGATEEEARIQLRKIFKLDKNKIDRMFSGEPLILKRGIPRQDADKYKKAFLKIGLVCTIHPLKQLPDDSPENLPPPVEVDINWEKTSVPVITIPEIKKKEDSMLNVREVLGFTGKGLKNPESEIEIYESETPQTEKEVFVSDSSEVADTSYNEITPDSELLKTDQIPDPQEVMIPGETGGDYPSSRFRIVFSGEIGAGQTTENVKQALSEIFGIEDRDVNILFSNMPVVLKDNVEENRAIQYLEQFHTVGAEVRLVRAGS